MKRPHLLRVEEEPERFATVLSALAGAGLRAGWLELGRTPEPPPGLAAAARLGALRAVASAGPWSLAVKLRRGAPVLADLLREHFLGCRLVLVRDLPGRGAEQEEKPRPAAALALLSPWGEEWRIEGANAVSRHLTTEELIAELRRPHPWWQAADPDPRAAGAGRASPSSARAPLAAKGAKAAKARKARRAPSALRAAKSSKAGDA